MAQAKAKLRKKRDALAISAYRSWLDQNPNADHTERVKMFNYFVDSATLKNSLDDAA